MASLRQCFKVCHKVIYAKTPIIETRGFKRWVAPTLKEIKRRKDKAGPEPITHRSTFLEWNYNAEIFAFGKRLHENIDNRYLQQAFTHRSYIIQEELKQREVGIENPEVTLKDNKELIELGDKIISEYVEAFLTVSLPKFPLEGVKSVKEFLLTDDNLSNISLHLGTKDIILSSEFPVGKETLSSTLKAVVGAINKSSGLQRSCEFVRDFIITQLNSLDINEVWNIENPIEFLKDIYKKKNNGELEPRLIAEAGRNTILAAYEVGIYCNKKLLGVGSGESVDIAHTMAAREALKKYFKTADNMINFNYQLPISAIQNVKNLSM